MFRGISISHSTHLINDGASAKITAAIVTVIDDRFFYSFEDISPNSYGKSTPQLIYEVYSKLGYDPISALYSYVKSDFNNGWGTSFENCLDKMISGAKICRKIFNDKQDTYLDWDAIKKDILDYANTIGVFS